MIKDNLIIEFKRNRLKGHQAVSLSSGLEEQNGGKQWGVLSELGWHRGPPWQAGL